MRFVSIQDYIDYIMAHPECNSDYLATGTMMHRRTQDDLLETVKYLIDYYYKPKELSKTITLKSANNNKRDIEIIKCFK